MTFKQIPLMLIFISSGVFSQDEIKAGKEETLEKIIIIFEKYPHYQPLMEIGGGEIWHKSQLSISPIQMSNMIDAIPQVSLNGQGGMMQMYSIRGMSRWRVQTLVEGIPIHTDRRAGSGAEFIAPQLIQQVRILPGAASTFFGSGALGGAIDLQLRSSEQSFATITYGSAQNNREFSTQFIGENNELAVVLRNADNSNSPKNIELNDQFNQQNIFWRHAINHINFDEIIFLYSNASDIGKSSHDFPENKKTDYPKNQQVLGKLSFHNELGSGELFFHDGELETNTLRIGKSENSSQSKSLNVGGTFLMPWHSNQWQGKLSFEVQSRQKVKIKEQEKGLNHDYIINFTSLYASQWEYSVFADANRQMGSLSLTMGSRVSYIEQKNKMMTHLDSNLSGYIGAKFSFHPFWQWRALASSAYRTPSLTELYFKGQTPRGLVLGNDKLSSEQANNIEMELAYRKNNTDFSLLVFSQHIQHYIERVEVSNELLQYQNIGRGHIYGISYNSGWQVTPETEIRLSGHRLKGVDQHHQPLLDINPEEHHLSVHFFKEKFTYSMQINYRARKTDFAIGEQALSSATTLSLGLSYQLSAELNSEITISNLTNENYRLSADELAPWATERNIQLSLTTLF